MKSTQNASPQSALLQRYGDTLYDLCHSVLLDGDAAQFTYRKIAQDLAKVSKKAIPESFERAWLFHFAANHLVAFERHRPKQVDPIQSFEDAGSSTEGEQIRFKYYFGRLSPADRILLILSDKFDFSLDEIATILKLPAESLKLAKSQALTRLSEQVLDTEGQKPQTVKGSQITSKLAHQPRISLPEETKKNPLSKKRTTAKSFKARLAQWRKSPWYIRVSVEGIVISVTILGLVLSVPKLRQLYEKNLDRRLESYNVEELAPERGNTPFLGAKLPQQPAIGAIAEPEGDGGDEEAEDIKEEPLSPVKIHEGEIWRFYIKTESPLEMRTKIAKILQSLAIHEDNPGFRGLEAPGGIQFDLLVGKDTVIKLRQEMDSLAKAVLSEAGNEALTLNQVFTWYRGRSKKPIPSSKTRVVIWLSQI